MEEAELYAFSVSSIMESCDFESRVGEESVFPAAVEASEEIFSSLSKMEDVELLLTVPELFFEPSSAKRMSLLTPVDSIIFPIFE